MSQNLFKWKHFENEIILLCVRWYLKYPLSYRNLVEMMAERGLNITHTTIMRWVHQYSPILDTEIRKYLKQTNDSWRMDETYIKIKGKNAYLYRAVDSEGNTIEFHVSENRDKDAAKNFFRKVEAILDRLPNAKVIEKEEMYSIVTAKIFGDGFIRWILSQGNAVEVLEPIELRNSIREEAIEILNMYSNGDDKCYV